MTATIGDHPAYAATWGLPERRDATVTACWCGCEAEIAVADAVWVPVTWPQPDWCRAWLDVPVPFAPGCATALPSRGGADTPRNPGSKAAEHHAPTPAAQRGGGAPTEDE